MTLTEEAHINNLHQAILQKFGDDLVDQKSFWKKLTFWWRKNVQLDIEQSGTAAKIFHLASRRKSCRIEITNSEKKTQQEALIEFEVVLTEMNRDVAFGNTHSQEQALKLIHDFLHGKTLDQLYYNYDFINVKKRKLSALRMVINDVYPFLTSIEFNQINDEIPAFPELEIQDGERRCLVNYHSGIDHPRWIFCWGGKRIFECNNHFDAINAQIAMRWVYEKAMPSELKEDYPEQDFGRLGDYYEQGKGQEGEFILSWEEAIKNLKLGTCHQDILHFVHDLANQGYNKKFMANAHLYTLVLSRSDTNMKLSDQPFISIRFYENKSEFSLKDVHGNLQHFKELRINEEIIRVLKELENSQV